MEKLSRTEVLHLPPTEREAYLKEQRKARSKQWYNNNKQRRALLNVKSGLVQALAFTDKETKAQKDVIKDIKRLSKQFIEKY